MVKIIYHLILMSIFSLLSANMTHAADTLDEFNQKNTQKVIMTEMVPGATGCECWYSGNDAGGQWMPSGNDACRSTPVEYRKYRCATPTGLAGFEATFAAIIKYTISIVMLLGVLGIVGLGIAWTFAGGDDIKMKSSLKKWGVNILIGLTLLFLFTYILRFLAPWVYQ